MEDQIEIIDLIKNNKVKLKTFFDNNFNESKHSDYKDFFKDLIEIIFQLFTDYPKSTLEENKDRLYGALRFIHFLNAKDDNE